MGYILTFQDRKNQKFYCYDEDRFNLIIIVANDDLIRESAFIRSGSKNELPLDGHLPYEVYLSDVQERKRRQENGLKAQELFKLAARQQLFIVEEIPQDKESISNYKVIKSLPIKRADYNIKNCKNIEVDVKCLTFYLIHDIVYFYIDSYEIQKLENLNKLTKKKTIFAIYNQAEIDLENCSLVMIELLKIRKKKKSVIYDKKTGCYKVPLRITTNGFELLEAFRIKENLYEK